MLNEMAGVIYNSVLRCRGEFFQQNRAFSRDEETTDISG